MGTTNIAFVAALLAATLTAQHDAQQALQRALLIEQKEGDLRAAEQEYRTLLANTDAAVANEAALHLGELLWRLERTAEAQPLLERAQQAGGDVGARATAVLQGQDPGGQQAQAAAAKVRDVVDRVLRNGNDQVAIDEMKWLGAAVVPEFGRRLAALHDPVIEAMRRFWEDRQKQPFPVRDAADATLRVLYSSSTDPNPAPQAPPIVRQLFQLGGKEAATILQAQLRDPEPWWRRTIAAATGGPPVPETMSPVLEAMVGDADPEGAVPVLAMQAAAAQLPIETYARQLASERSNVREAAWTSLPRNPVFLTMWQTTEATARALTLVLPLVERELASGDPSRLRVAFAFLRMVAGFDERASELLLQWLPKVPVFEQGGQPQNLRASLAHLLDCAKLLGPADGSDGRDARRLCIAQAALPLAKKGEAALLLDLVDLGYDRLASKPLAAAALNLAPSAADVVRAAELLGRCHDSSSVLNEMNQRDVPPEAWSPLLRHLDGLVAKWPPDKGDGRPLPGDQQEAANEAIKVFRALGLSGSAAALPRLRELRGQRSDLTMWVASTVLAIASRGGDDAAVGAALRELLVEKALSPEHRNEAFGALVARGDEQAIPLFAQAYAFGLKETRVTKAIKQGARVGDQMVVGDFRGVGWLGTEGHDRYSFAQQLAIWQPLLAGDQWRAAIRDARDDSPRPVQLAMLDCIVARLRSAGDGAETESSLDGAVGSLAQNAPTDDAPDSVRYRAAVATLCQDARVGGVAINALGPAVVSKLADTLRAALRTPLALAAFEALQRGNVAVSAADVLAVMQQAKGGSLRRFLGFLPRDAAPEVVAAVESLLGDPDEGLRIAACQTLGRLLSANSAPALLTALRDSDSNVREAATAALQQIRLYHEQKAFWDQFQTGISTGREAAAAKLLAQAKPDQPKDQRLLALGSLGALGAPEALPYLIDWSKDADADVAKAARAAIDRIQAAAEHK